MYEDNRHSEWTFVRAALLAGFIAATSCTGSFCQTAPATQSPFTGPVSGKVSMTLFKIVEQKGKKNLETPTGEFVPISTKHLAKDATMIAVYRDSQNNYWFINKEGKPTPIPPQKVQWAVNQISEQRLAKEQTQAAIAAEQSAGNYSNNGYANSGQAPVQQTTIIQQPSSGSGSGAVAGYVGTGLAAAGGAMVGGLIGDSLYDNNHFYGAPYGAPLYRDGNRSYYVNNGNRVYLNNSHLNAVNNQWDHQGEWNNRDSWSEGTHEDHLDRGFREGWGGFRGRR